MSAPKAILTPFYGLSRRGTAVSKILNRMLILLEVGAMLYGSWYHFSSIFIQRWWTVLFIAACFPCMAVINRLLQSFWNFLVAFYYGTTDPDEIGRVIARKESKIDARKAERIRKRDSRKHNRTVSIKAPVKKTDGKSLKHNELLMRESIIY